MPARQLRPLWKCPDCGHKFVTKNLWHSCGRYRLADHFVGAEPMVRRTFNRWRQAARNLGPVTIYAQKTRIIFMVRVRFAGAMVRRTWLEATLWLKKKPAHPRLHRLEDYGRLGYGLHLKLTKPSDIDSKLLSLLKQAYSIGRQEHL